MSEFTPQERLQLIEGLQAYFLESLDHELGRFDAEFLLDHISERMEGGFTTKGCSMRRQ